MMRALPVAVLAAAAACHIPPSASAFVPAREGTAVAVYAGDEGGSYALVDDRRWVQVEPGQPLVLADIDPAAPLESLLIESATEAGALVVGACTRAPAAAETIATVRCELGGHPRRGRQLLRVAYTTTSISFRVEHSIQLTDDAHAQVSTAYTVRTPRLGRRADVSLFEGRPGGDHAPNPLARGVLAFEGDEGVLAMTPRTVVANVRYLFELPPDTVEAADADPAGVGAQVPRRYRLDADAKAALDQTKLGSVWVTLVVRGEPLARGALRVNVSGLAADSRVVDVPATAVESQAPGAPLRVPLWVDDTLVVASSASRRHSAFGSGRSRSVEVHSVTITNKGPVARDVDIEHRLRPARARAIVDAGRTAPVRHGDLLRSRVHIAAQATVNTHYTVAYID